MEQHLNSRSKQAFARLPLHATCYVFYKFLQSKHDMSCRMTSFDGKRSCDCSRSERSIYLGEIKTMKENKQQQEKVKSFQRKSIVELTIKTVSTISMNHCEF